MAEVPKTEGPRFEALPPLPKTPPLSETTGKIKMLMEEELEEMLWTLPETSFETPEVRSIKTLIPPQKANLFNLIPIEQELSPGTPLLNEAIQEKRKYDLENICKNPIYWHPNLHVPLPEPSEVPTLPPPVVRDVLIGLTQRVSDLMKSVQYNPKNETPDALLRDPAEMTELLTRYSFAQVVQCDARTLFESKDIVIKLISNKVNELILAYQTMKKALAEVPIKPPLPAENLIHALSKTIASLSSARTAEDFKTLCSDAIDISVKLEVERNTLIKSVCNYLKAQRESLAPFLSLAPADFFLAGPAFGEEERWISSIIEQKQKMAPFIYLIEQTQQFLAPYLNGQITQETENTARGDVKNSILPQFHSEFPNVSLTDAALEHFLLNAYLKIAGQGVDLRLLEQTRPLHLGEAGQAKAAGKEDIAKDRENKAQEIQNEIDLRIANLIAALEHSLQIDFGSMNLTPNQIRFLAIHTLFNPNEPLPRKWKEIEMMEEAE